MRKRMLLWVFDRRKSLRGNRKCKKVDMFIDLDPMHVMVVKKGLCGLAYHHDRIGAYGTNEHREWN